MNVQYVDYVYLIWLVLMNLNYMFFFRFKLMNDELGFG